MTFRRMFALPALLVATFAQHGLAAETPAPPGSAVTLRYGLAPGDHFVYRETFERVARSGREESAARYEWETHVLVAAEREGLSAVGFQRNRTSARLLYAREAGADRTEREQGEFEARVARLPARFAEGNRLDAAGWAAGPWAAAREAHSETLFAVHELEPLPREAVTPAASWRGGSLLGFEYRFVKAEPSEPAGCRVIEGKSGGGALRSRVVHCDVHGPTRVVVQARYDVPGAQIEETLRYERVEVRHAEAVEVWLTDPALALGALAAAHHAPWLPLPAPVLHAAASGADADVARQALSLMHRRRLPPPPGLDALRASGDRGLRAIAERMAAPEPAAGPAGCPPRRRPADLPGTTLRLMSVGRLEGWPYVLHVPEDYRGDAPFPLIVYLGGGPGRALLALASAKTAIAEGRALVLMPQADGMWWDEGSDRVLDALLGEVFARFNVDHDRVYLAGSSNGATGAWRLAARHPDLFAAVSLLMGAGPSVPRPPAPTANFEGLDVLMLHGADDEVIPSAFHRRSVSEMKDKAPGARLEEAVLPGHGHDLRLDSDGGQSLLFFAARRRDPFPRRVRLATREPARRAWVEVADDPGGTADVTGVIDGGVVRLTTRGAGRMRLLLRAELAPEGMALRVEQDGAVAWEGTVKHDADLLRQTCGTNFDPARAYSMVIELPAARAASAPPRTPPSSGPAR